MGIAMLTLSHMFNGLQRLSRSLNSSERTDLNRAGPRALARTRPLASLQTTRMPSVLSSPQKTPATPRHRPTGINPRLGLALTRHTPASPRLPLRVLRITDSHAQPGTLGRLVISGRMVDVCAELDRLAALESAQTLH